MVQTATRKALVRVVTSVVVRRRLTAPVALGAPSSRRCMRLMATVPSRDTANASRMTSAIRTPLVFSQSTVPMPACSVASQRCIGEPPYRAGPGGWQPRWLETLEDPDDQDEEPDRDQRGVHRGERVADRLRSG